MEFEFDKQLEAQNSIEIENIGDFGLEAIDEDGLRHYLAVKTLYGWSVIASCGPVMLDTDVLPSGFSTGITKMAYKEDRLNKFISLWLNDKSKKIKEAEVLSFDEAILEFKNITDYLNNLSEDTF